MSENGFSTAMAILITDAPIISTTPLLPLLVIDKLDTYFRKLPSNTKVETAVWLADNLLGQLPSLDMHNAKVFYNSIVAIFTAYPFDVGVRAAHPVHGVIANLKFKLKPSDLKGYMDAEIARRNQAIGMLAKHKAERARRDKAQQEDNAWRNERSRLSAAQRADAVQQAIRPQAPA